MWVDGFIYRDLNGTKEHQVKGDNLVTTKKWVGYAAPSQGVNAWVPSHNGMIT